MNGVLRNDVLAVSTVLEADNLGYWNFNVLGPFTDTLLHIAASYGNYEMCEKLLNCDADVNALNTNDETPLHIAEIKGVWKQKMLGKKQKHERNEFLKICKLLLKSRKEEDITYYSQLHREVKSNYFELTRQHLNSIDVNEIDTMKRTPLHVAVLFAKDEICDLLLENGADVQMKDHYSDTPIKLAFYKERFELRERMLSRAYCGYGYHS